MTRERGIDRRGFVALGVGAFAWALTPAVLAGRARLWRRTVPAMGTLAELAVVDVHGSHAHAALDLAVEELARTEALMTRFRPDSDVGRANLGAFRGPVVVSAETAEVLGEALRWARASAGSFDPCLARAVALWDVERRTEPPPAEALQALAGRALWRSLEVETAGSVPRVRFRDAAVGIDLGGIAKGYGVDRALAALRAAGVGGALVNVGGDLAGFGASPEGDPWEVGVRDPKTPDRILETLTLEEGALATSGDYLRAFRWRGRTYHHLLDAASAAPRVSGMRSLTVFAPTCVAADAAATAAFGVPLERARGTLARVASARVVHTV